MIIMTGERLLIIAMMIWSTCTALTPAAASLGNAPIIAIRVLLGAGEGDSYLRTSMPLLIFYAFVLLLLFCPDSVVIMFIR